MAARLTAANVTATVEDGYWQTDPTGWESLFGTIARADRARRGYVPDADEADARAVQRVIGGDIEVGPSPAALAGALY